MTTPTDKTTKGYRCSACAKVHHFSAWVYAHWDEEVTHTCDAKGCGKKHTILRGNATPLGSMAAQDTPAKPAYIVVTAITTFALERDVNVRVEDGYIPIGGVSRDGGAYMQSMLHREVHFNE